MSELDTSEISRALQGLLRWYVAMGVDTPIDEVAHDRFVAAEPAENPGGKALSETAPFPQAPGAPPRHLPASLGVGDAGRREAAPASADALVAEAQTSAAAARDLEDLAARWAALPGCSLATSAGRMVLAGGTPGARLMLIAGAPEADDERQGTAFAGERGALLDAMLGAIGLDRSRVYLANLIPWRPPGARAPTALELSLCLPFARRHIALADPAIIVCLGERAAQPLLASREPLSRLRGRWLAYEGDAKAVKTLVTFSPDYLLKQPLQKRRAWSDLQMLAATLAE